MSIITEYVCPPIPDRDHDWNARFDWDDDAEEGQLFGEGPTESRAVFDLVVKAQQKDPASAYGDEISTMAFANWVSDQPRTAPIPPLNAVGD